MCTYGIGLPFDHPIWRNLPPCRCGPEQRWSETLKGWRWWENPVVLDKGTITWIDTTGIITFRPTPQ